MRGLALVAGLGAALAAVFLLTFARDARPRADFIWNNTSEPQSLDPQRMSGQTEGELAAALFEGLTVFHPRTLEPLPGVARSWEVTGLRYRFHLREDSWWVQRGVILRTARGPARVTAEDFVASWRSLAYPERGSDFGHLLNVVDGYEEYAAAVSAQWISLVARYASERPERVVVSPADLYATDRSAVERLREGLWRDSVGVRAIDSSTLEVHLRSAAPYFTHLTSFYPFSPVPASVVNRHGEAWTAPETIATNGPYLLDSWRFNSFVRLRKNPFYWETEAFARRRLREIDASAAGDGDSMRSERELLASLGSFERRGLERLEAWAIEEQNTSLNLYINGDVDRVRELPATVAGELIAAPDASDRGAHVHHGPQLACYLYNVNVSLDVFAGAAGRKLRRAMALAIDREGLIETVTRERQIPAYGLVPPGVPRYSSRKLFGGAGRAQDLAEARNLMQEVRASRSSPLPRLRILYNTNENHAKIAAFIQAGWKEHLGLECDMTNQEWGVFLDSRKSGDFDIARMGWVGDYPDAYAFLHLFVSSDPSNDCGYANPLLDWLVLEVIPHLERILSDPVARDDVVERLLAQVPRGDPAGAARAQELRDAFEAFESAGALEGDRRQESVFALRRLLLERAEEIVMADMPVIPIYFYVRAQLWPPELEGCWSNVLDYHPPKFLRWRNDERPRGSRYDVFRQER